MYTLKYAVKVDNGRKACLFCDFTYRHIGFGEQAVRICGSKVVNVAQKCTATFLFELAAEIRSAHVRVTHNEVKRKIVREAFIYVIYGIRHTG